MLLRRRVDIESYRSLLGPGFQTECRLHDDCSAIIKIIAAVQRHRPTGAHLTLYVGEQTDASNIILAALTPVRAIREGLVAVMVVPYQQHDQERRNHYRGDGVFLGSKSRAIQTMLAHIDDCSLDTEWQNQQYLRTHPSMEAMCRCLSMAAS